MNIPKILPLIASLCLCGCNVTFMPASPDTVVASPDPDVLLEADVTPVVVDEYYFVNGQYYYWHPGVGRYVLLRGEPPPGFRISRTDHLAPRDREGHPLEPRPAVRPVAASPQQQQPAPQQKQQKAQPDQKKQKKTNDQ